MADDGNDAGAAVVDDKDAVIAQLQQSVKDLQESLGSLQSELKATKEENESLKIANAKRRSSSSGGAKSPRRSSKTPATPPPANGGSGKKVKAPSSRLYNPRKFQENHMKREKIKVERDLAKCSFKPQTSSAAKRAPRPSGPATERLFQQGRRQQERRALLASRKGEEEIMDCTFSPNIDKKSVEMAKASPDHKDTFNRLSKPRVYKINDMQGLDDKELLECTFTPKLITPAAKKNQVATHDRLYAEAILRQSKRAEIKKAKEDKERAMELDGCTFAPQVNSNAEFAGINQEPVFERLGIKDVEARQEKQDRLKKNAEKKLTFQPKIRKNKKYQTANGDIIERLYEAARHNRDEEPKPDENCTFTPKITSLASKIDRGDLPTHERLALEMSPSQKIALADMEDYYEEDDEYYDEEDEEYEEGDMEEIDDDEEEDDDDDDDEDIELP